MIYGEVEQQIQRDHGILIDELIRINYTTLISGNISLLFILTVSSPMLHHPMAVHLTSPHPVRPFAFHHYILIFFRNHDWNQEVTSRRIM